MTWSIYLPKQKMKNISRMQECSPLVSFDPLSNTIVDLNKPKIIGNSGELSDLEYLHTKTEKVNISRMQEHAPIVFFGPLDNTILDLNKPKIIRNSGELTDLDYLPPNQKMQNISRTRTHKPLISSGPLSYTGIHFKQALNDGEGWRTDKDQVHPPVILGLLLFGNTLRSIL